MQCLRVLDDILGTCVGRDGVKFSEGDEKLQSEAPWWARRVDMPHNHFVVVCSERDAFVGPWWALS